MPALTPAEVKLLLEYLSPYHGGTMRNLGMAWLVTGKKGQTVLSLEAKGYFHYSAGWFLTDKGQKWLDRHLEA